MLFKKVIAFASLAITTGVSASGLKFRGALNPNPKLDNTYLLEFDAGQSFPSLGSLFSCIIRRSSSSTIIDLLITADTIPLFTVKGVNAVETVKTALAAQGSPMSTSVPRSTISSLTVFPSTLAPSMSVVAAIPKAKELFYVHKINSPEPVAATEGAPLFTPESIHSLTGVNDARNKLGLTGKGIKVAIIDTGVFYQHAALGGGFGPGKKVAFGWDLVGDDYDASNNNLKPDADPTDNCTHVAGIVGADARSISDPAYASDIPFTGVAPEVTLGATGFSDAVLEAIYMAAADGADVINLSIGGGPAYADSPDAVAATRVGEIGHFVFGIQWWFWSGIFRKLGSAKPFLNVAGGEYSYYLGGNNGNFDFGKEYDVIVNDMTADETDKQTMVQPLPPLTLVTGKALLIRWGDTAFGGSARRCNTAAATGAVACILYANTESVPNIAGSALIPSLATDRAAGQAIIAAIKAEPHCRFHFYLSSPGLDQELQIKPDFGGIGGEVFSTISKFSQGDSRTPYRSLSGTSMASPYAAGVAALVLQAYGRNRPTFDQLRTALQNTANPQKKYGTDLIDSVAYQGAGLINAYGAITTKTVVYPSRLAFNDTKNTAQHYELTVTNKATVDISYTVKHQPALLVTPFTAGDDSTLTADEQTYTADYASILFSRNNDRVPSLEFTLKAGASHSFNVHVQPPANAIAGLYPVYSGYIVVSAGEQKLASVPYAGLVGDWRAAPIWSRTSAKFDTVLPLAAGGLEELGIPVAENATASTGLYAFDSAFYKGKDWKSLAALGIKRETSLYLFAEMALSLDPDSTGAIVPTDGYTLSFNTLQRNSPTQGQRITKPTAFIWTGRVISNATGESAQSVKLPAGPYQVRFTALKHFGRVGSPVGKNDWDTIFSPTFNVVY
ncbi:peptidase S8/S53 domain-containing protein [Chytridium lagenaria]|nr:peptidase S8/S53 domain-containing protein [Chytridium lagenaria]